MRGDFWQTEKVGLAAGAAARMLLIAKICDAFSNLAMGKIMDKVNSPKGKCRPWFLWRLAPTAAIIIMMFTVPKASSGLQPAYVLVTNILISAVIYTAIAIPYGSMMAVRTESVEERGKMGIARTVFGYLIGMVIAIALIPITNMLGPNGVADQAAWIKVGAVFAVLSGPSLFILYRSSKENVEIQKLQSNEKQEPFLEELKLLFKNKYWVLMLIAMLFVNISYGLSASGGTYYAKYILGNDNSVGLLGAIGLIPTFLGFILVGPLTRKFGMSNSANSFGARVGSGIGGSLIGWLLARQNGLYVMLDMHQDLFFRKWGDGAPLWAALDEGAPHPEHCAMWYDVYLQSEAIIRAAAQFPDYDPTNPLAMSAEQGAFYMGVVSEKLVSFDRETLMPFCRRMQKAVARVSEKPLITGGNTFAT